MAELSERLRRIVDDLPLVAGMRVLEIGGAPGAAAREVFKRIAPGQIVVLDRSPKGVAQLESTCRREIDDGLMVVVLGSIEAYRPDPDDKPFDLIFANRVGVLDGRHPKQEAAALNAIRTAASVDAKFFLDGVDVTERIR